MPRMTLREMNPVQARQHYDALVDKRIDRAQAMQSYASHAPRDIRTALVKQAQDALDKALFYSRPCRWQADRALKLRDDYGMGVAAAFLAAHNWPLDRAHRELFGK